MSAESIADRPLTPLTDVEIARIGALLSLVPPEPEDER